MQAHQVVTQQNCSGLMLLIHVKTVMQEMNDGDVLAIPFLAQPHMMHVRQWMQRTGHHDLGMRQFQKQWWYYVKKASTPHDLGPT